MIKRPVKFSSYVGILSATVTVAAAGFCIYQYRRTDLFWFYTMCVCFAISLIFVVIYTPLSISVDSKALRIRRLLLTRTIPMNQIESVARCSPTMGARRVCGSGGFYGYWGWFSERDLGKYFAYYGKASDCFLVTLKNGRRYMLGCEDPQSVADFIKEHIK